MGKLRDLPTITVGEADGVDPATHADRPVSTRLVPEGVSKSLGRRGGRRGGHHVAVVVDQSVDRSKLQLAMPPQDGHRDPSQGTAGDGSSIGMDRRQRG
jgi:hypothetical protein